LVPPAIFDPHAIRYFSGTCAEARRKFLDAAAGQGRGSRGDSANGLDRANTKLTKLPQLNLNSHLISGG
jgi:hypothetical protein